MVDSQFWFISLSLSSVLLLLVTLYALDFDLLSPVIATQSSLTIASILCTIMVKQWQLPMHGSTVILLITAQMVMTLGSLYVAHCLNDRSLVKANISSQSMNDVYIPMYRQYVLWILLGIILGLAGHEMYTLAEKAGNKNGILGIASSIRPYIMAESSTIKLSRWMPYH